MVHGSRTIVEEDEETYHFVVNLIISMSRKYDWVLPVPGFWHILFLQGYFLADFQAIFKLCGADDEPVLGG